MSKPLVAAAVQMTSGPELARNLEKAALLIARAADRGAELVVLPENFAIMTGAEADKRAAAETIDFPNPTTATSGTPETHGRASPGRIISAMAEVAARHQLHLVLGGMPERSAVSGERVHNSCVLLGPEGTVKAVYRKIHLFDVFIPDGAI